VLKWVESGALSFDWALRVDALTAVMLVVITTVSALVHLYSWGYMEEDPTSRGSSPTSACSPSRC
jgi:NADH-quinone oxidoreductase subunit L